MGDTFFSSLEFVFMKKTVSLKRFLKEPFINMPHIFGNMVYLNIKERDRFWKIGHGLASRYHSVKTEPAFRVKKQQLNN